MASCPNCKTDVNSLVAESLNQYEFTVDEEGINYDDKCLNVVIVLLNRRKKQQPS